eukprot:4279106-Lingulodinium_polyedra.AAC.1
MYLDAGAAIVSGDRFSALVDLADRFARHGVASAALRKSRGPPTIAANDRGSQINGGRRFFPAQARSCVGPFPNVYDPPRR